MSLRPNSDDYAALFLHDTPMLDVRAPIEYQQGAFPHTVNLPLMDDEERRQVGTCYKVSGQDAAIALGHQLVTGEIKQQRVAAWQGFAKANPSGYLYCFRGGLRSRITQQWLAEAGVDYPFVQGGYKAMRRFLIDSLEYEARRRPLVVISGRTGTGKTKVIEQVRHALDLERLANHRGSSFGRRTTPQPTQINFENQLSIALLKLQGEHGSLLVEDESNAIGSAHVPECLFASMKQAPLVVLEESMEARIDTVIGDYVIDLSDEYNHCAGDQGPQAYAQYMLASLDRVRKRLGSERHLQIRECLQQALDLHLRDRDVSLMAHRRWIKMLLEQYYDRMYDYQLSKKQDRVLFRGNRQEVVQWFEAYRTRQLL